VEDRRGVVRRGIALGVATTALGAMAFAVATGTVAAPPPNVPPPVQVVVTNTPLPVTGTVTGNVGVTGTVNVAGNVGVSGTVGATQSGAWNVGLTGNPSVKSGDTTQLLDSFAGVVQGGGVFTEAAGADVSGSKSVRVLTNCFSGGSCANIEVRIYTVTSTGRSYLLDRFPMQNFQATSNVYDTAGTSLAVQLINSNAGPVDNVGVAIFGRAN